MKKVLTGVIATGFFAASATFAAACTYHSASAKHNLVVAEAETPTDEQAASTFDPEKLKLEEEKKAE